MQRRPIVSIVRQESSLTVLHVVVLPCVLFAGPVGISPVSVAAPQGGRERERERKERGFDGCDGAGDREDSVLPCVAVPRLRGRDGDDGEEGKRRVWGGGVNGA